MDRLSWMQDAAPACIFQHSLGIFPKMTLKSAYLVNLASLKTGNFRVTHQFLKRPPLEEIALSSESFLRLSWQMKGLGKPCECLKTVEQVPGLETAAVQARAAVRSQLNHRMLFQVQMKGNGFSPWT